MSLVRDMNQFQNNINTEDRKWIGTILNDYSNRKHCTLFGVKRPSALFRTCCFIAIQQKSDTLDKV